MARPWDYPGWRRAAMQGVMWVILGGTLGLAGLVTYHRNHAPPVALDASVRLGMVDVRLPSGWYARQSRIQGGWVLHARDSDMGRQLIVTELVGRVDDAEPEGVISSEPLEFKGLRQTGRLMVVRRTDAAGGRVIRFDRLDGQVTLPSGLTLLLHLDQANAIRPGPADSLLLKQIAAAMTLVQPSGSDKSDQARGANFPEVSVTRPGDAADVEEQDGTVYINLRAQGPTGGAKLVRRQAWPGKIVLRFMGAEGISTLDVANGRILLRTTSDGDAAPELYRLGAGGGDDAIPFDPAFATAFEKDDGGLAIVVPPAMYPAAVRDLRVHWIMTPSGDE